MRSKYLTTVGVLALAVLFLAPQTGAAQDKPNILVIMGDDIGYWNLSEIMERLQAKRVNN